MNSSWTYIGLAGAAVILGATFVGLKGASPSQHPLAYMPGTQPDGQMFFEPSSDCMRCHADYDKTAEPGHLWQGSMMAQAARDPLFWSALTVAMQDARWAFGTSAPADACIRCHLPTGWLRGRSTPVNGSSFTGDDFEGVNCNLCHRMYDPFFEDTAAGTRESNDFTNYWDEASNLSQILADSTLAEDRAQAADLTLFNGEPAYENNRPVNTAYDENASGQFYVAKATSLADSGAAKRGPYADAPAYHTLEYSRYHKSKFMCAACHDVSNIALANFDYINSVAGDGTTVLPSESQPAYSFHPAERTFSEFMASSFGQPGGAAGTGPFAPDRFNTAQPGNLIASCQDCHMADVTAAASAFTEVRPDTSLEHPNTGVGIHDLTGGNLWVPYLLASTVADSPNFDATNAMLLNDKASSLTLDLDQGIALNPEALLDGVDRARSMLERAATITISDYNSTTGELEFRITNHTGHKLITGYPEGRRMFVNIRLYAEGTLIHEINPYDETAGTLRGLGVPGSPDVNADEAHADSLIYESLNASSITGEDHTFHFLLADGPQKDNRIPPMGFDTAEAARRLALPAANGATDVNVFTTAEYAGGHDDIVFTTVPGADGITVGLYYQTTSREYMEFLRDEINGATTKSLPNEAYIAQTDGEFGALKAWGDTMWALWDHNKNIPGAAPVPMAIRTYLGYDANGDGIANAIDIQIVINGVLGLAVGPYSADVNNDGSASSVDVQLMINRALGLT